MHSFPNLHMFYFKQDRLFFSFNNWGYEGNQTAMIHIYWNIIVITLQVHLADAFYPNDLVIYRVTITVLQYTQ